MYGQDVKSTVTEVGTVGWQDALDDYDDADWLSVSLFFFIAIKPRLG